MFCNCFVSNYVKIQHIYGIKIICHRGYNRIASNKEENKMANTHRHGSTQNLSSNEGSSSFVFTNSLGNEEHTPSREKGKKHKMMKYFLQKGT